MRIYFTFPNVLSLCLLATAPINPHPKVAVPPPCPACPCDSAAQLEAGLARVPPPGGYSCKVIPAGMGEINGELIKCSFIFY